jgi:hypothetical protein
MAFDRDEVIIGHGKHIAYSDDGVTYTTVDGTVDISLPERELGATEITNDDSPNFHKDYIPGLYEPGKVNFTYRYTKTQFAALETIYQKANTAATRGDATKTWKVTLPDASTAVFNGFLTSHNLPIDGGEDSPVVEGEIQVIGLMTWTNGA